MRVKFLFLTLVLIAIIFASWNDNYYTGQPCTHSSQCGLGYSCFEGKCLYGSPPCYDLDGGMNTETKGQVYTEYDLYEDECYSGAKVIEYYCSGITVEVDTVDCPEEHVCSEGACVSAPCVDSDGGLELEEKGTAVDEGETSYTDTCLTEDIIAEAICEGNGATTINYYCPSDTTCEEGACIEIQEEPEEPEPEETITCGNHGVGDSWYVDECNVCACTDEGKLLCTDHNCDEILDQQQEEQEEEQEEPLQDSDSESTLIAEEEPDLLESLLSNPYAITTITLSTIILLLILYMFFNKLAR